MEHTATAEALPAVTGLSGWCLLYVLQCF